MELQQGVASSRRSGWVALIEVALALVATLIVSMLFMVLAFVVTAAVIEEDGAQWLLRDERRLSIDLHALDGENAPELAAAQGAAQAALEGVDVVWAPLPDDGWRLLAWYESDFDQDRVSQLVAEFARLGWQQPSSTEITQSRLQSVVENPHKMKFYGPAGMTFQSLFFIVVAALMVRWRKPARVAPTQGFKQALPWGLLSAITALLAGAAVGGILQLLGVEVEEQAWIQALFADHGALLVLSPWLVLFGPISEEVFFRGYVFRRLLAASGPGLAYATSALLFALIHAHPVGFPMYALIGLIFAWVYRRTGTLWAPVIGHVIYNFFVLALPFVIAAMEGS